MGALRFVGELEEPRGWLAAADALVSASKEEGFSNSVLEAMMAGLPVIATSVGGTPEALDDDARWLVPPVHVDSMAEAMRAAFDDPEGARDYGAQLQARARGRFTVERMCGDMRELYEGLIDEDE